MTSLTYEIPVMKPQLPLFDDVAPLLRGMDSARIYTNNGPIAIKFQQKVGEYLGVPSDRVVLLSNATVALQGAIELGLATDWIVPDFTFAATGHAVLKAGKRLHLLDVNALDWTLDHNLVSKYTEKVSCGIIPVTPFGSTLNFVPWQAYEHVVFDAAASFGAPQPDFLEMKPSWFVIYSLHATKVLPSGEGAVVVCGSSGNAQKLRQWANFGFNSSRISVASGTNAKMSEIAAAYGLTSLMLKDRELGEWRNALNLAKTASANEFFDTKISQIDGARPYWIAKFESERLRSAMIDLLGRNRIQSILWWAAPLSSMKPFETATRMGLNPVSSHLANTVLGLPMFRGITFREVDAVLSVLQKGK